MMTILTALMMVFCGAVVAKEYLCAGDSIRKCSMAIHRHRTLAQFISFLAVLVVKCLADSTVVSEILNVVAMKIRTLSFNSIFASFDHCMLSYFIQI